ncbi:MAG: nuclear transport factor 2 family protein [Pseudomonadota bacterium]
MKKTLTACAVCVVIGHAAVADVAENKATAIAAMTEVFVGLDLSKIPDYFADPYIQHNPMAGSGVAALTVLLEGAKQGPGFGLETARIIGEGDLVAMHNVWTGFGPAPLVAFDVFRFNEDGKIVEHWDNLAPLEESPNPSGRMQIDGETEITDLDRGDPNKAHVVEMITKGFIEGEQIDFTQYISPETYLQHNTMAGDGLDGLMAGMQAMAEQGMAMSYSELPLTLAEGNFVLTGAVGAMGDTPTAFYDLFRLENGLIVEHWDVIAPIQQDNLPDGYPGKF